MKVKAFDSKGKNIEEVSLEKSIFDTEPNESALNQYIRVFKANQRQGTQSTKTRGEVQGSGAKPWAQKHTGRARAGEKRNPIWRHGGIAHGPKPRDWSLSLSSTIRSLAFKSALSFKAQEDKVYVVQDFLFERPSTKEAEAFIMNTELDGTVLIVLGDRNVNTIKSFHNLPYVKTALIDNVNTYDLLFANNVLFEKSSLDKLDKKFKK